MDKALTPCDPLAVLLAAPCTLISEGSQKEILVAGEGGYQFKMFVLCILLFLQYNSKPCAFMSHLHTTSRGNDWMCDLLLLQTPSYQQINSSSLCWT